MYGINRGNLPPRFDGAVRGVRLTVIYSETLSVIFKDRSKAYVLDIGVIEAVGFFVVHSNIHRALEILQNISIGYLHLGWQIPTMNDGEAQRIKLVIELVKAVNGARGGSRAAWRGTAILPAPFTCSTGPPSADTWRTYKSS